MGIKNGERMRNAKRVRKLERDLRVGIGGLELEEVNNWNIRRGTGMDLDEEDREEGRVEREYENERMKVSMRKKRNWKRR